MESMADYLRKLNDPAYNATNRFALAQQGLDIRLIETYRVLHEPTQAFVDVLKDDLDAECARLRAYSVHEKRAVLLRMVADKLKDEAQRRLPAGNPETTT